MKFTVEIEIDIVNEKLHEQYLEDTKDYLEFSISDVVNTYIHQELNSQFDNENTGLKVKSIKMKE